MRISDWSSDVCSSDLVGGSVMLAVPPALLDVLRLTAGAEVGLAVDNGRLVVEPKARPRYTMAELLASSDYSQTQPDRKSVVEGKSVSVRVDLGGRRIIKKKQQVRPRGINNENN